MLSQGGAHYATLTYTQVKGATDLTCTMEVSGALATWNGGSAYVTQADVVDQGTTRQVTVRDLTPLTNAAPRRFLRLRVTRG